MEKAEQLLVEERRTRQKRSWWKFVLAGIIGILILAGGGFVVWASDAASPMAGAVATLASDSQVSVQSQPWWVFQPEGNAPETGLVLYPGAKVDPRAYAPAAHRLAADGYLVVITPMPLNLAILSPGKASEVMQAFPDVKRWAVGGHSLGGAMAAQFAHDHPDEVHGLVLWAAYPPDGASLANWGGHVVSIYGTRDGLATQAKIDASRSLLPTGTKYVAIEGGNHAQFGWYGDQSGDNAATVSREEQQDQVVAATEDLLKSLK